MILLQHKKRTASAATEVLSAKLSRYQPIKETKDAPTWATAKNMKVRKTKDEDKVIEKAS